MHHLNRCSDAHDAHKLRLGTTIRGQGQAPTVVLQAKDTGCRHNTEDSIPEYAPTGRGRRIQPRLSLAAVKIGSGTNHWQFSGPTNSGGGNDCTTASTSGGSEASGVAAITNIARRHQGGNTIVTGTSSGAGSIKRSMDASGVGSRSQDI